jgi:ribonuclease-3
LTTLTDFEALLQVPFHDPALLREALTHSSYANEMEQPGRDNERLEFLGDAIIGFITAEMLFRRYGAASEGDLTRLRSALVKAESLAMLAQECRLGDFLLMGKGEEARGGRKRINTLCRAFEALVGAMYLDRGMERVRDFLLPALGRLLDYIISHGLDQDARSLLQERSQAELHITPAYRVTDTVGPEHEKEYHVEVLIKELILGQGRGASKRLASHAAARDALQRLETQGWSAEVQALAAAPPDADPAPGSNLNPASDAGSG